MILFFFLQILKVCKDHVWVLGPNPTTPLYYHPTQVVVIISNSLSYPSLHFYSLPYSLLLKVASTTYSELKPDHTVLQHKIPQ